MKIEGLRLRNFSDAYSDMEFHFPEGKVFLFAGRNGSGKTTLVNAVEYALTGKVKAFQKKNASDFLRRRNTGGDPFGVECGLSHWGGKFGVSRATGAANYPQNKIMAMLNTDEKLLDALFQIDRFMDMDEKKRQALVATLSGTEFTDSDLDMFGITDETCRKKVKNGNLKSAQDWMTDMRRLVQKNRDEFIANNKDIEGDGMFKPGEGEVKINLDEILGAPEKRKFYDDRIRQFEEGAAKLKGWIENPFGTEKAIQEQNDRLEQIATELDGMEGQLEEARKRETERGKIQSEINEMLSAKNTAEAGLNEIVDIIERVKAKGMVCPYGVDTICTVSQEKALLFLEGKKKAKEKGVEKALQHKIDAEKKLHLLTEQGKSEAELKQRRGSLFTKEKEINDRLANLPKDGDGKVIPHSTLVSQLTVAEREIAILNTMFNELEKRKAVLDSREYAEKHGEKLELEVAKYKGQEEALKNPELLKRITDGPEKILLDIAKDFESLGIPFPVDQLYNVKREMTLSESERYRLGIVYKAALSRLSGLGFLVIDGFEILDPENKKLLLKIIVKTLDWWEQVIILGSQVKENISPSKGQFRVFWVEDGTISEVKARDIETGALTLEQTSLVPAR